MGKYGFQIACLILGVVWVIAGDSASGQAWLAASVVIAVINKDGK